MWKCLKKSMFSICSTMVRNSSGKIGHKLLLLLWFLRKLATMILSFLLMIQSDSTTSCISTSKTIYMFFSVDRQVQVNLSMFLTNLSIIIMMPTTHSCLLPSQDKQMQIKCKDWSTVKSVQEEERDSIGLSRVETKSSFSLMILTCLKKKSMVHNLQSNF